MNKELLKPKFRLYVTVSSGVDVDRAKKFIKKRYKAEDVSVVQGGPASSLVFTTNAGNFSSLWKYLTKKRGVQTVRIGK